jgi:predicted GIY-YIG superfamily endonuclease
MRVKVMVELALIYSIRRQSDNAIKIGYTVNIENRLANLKITHGKCEIVYVHPIELRYAEIAELYSHALLEQYWIGHEWFRFYSPDIRGASVIRIACYCASRELPIDVSSIKERHKQEKAFEYAQTRLNIKFRDVAA